MERTQANPADSPQVGPKLMLLLVAAPGFLALLFEPARWLVTTWTDPTWDSSGLWVAALCLALGVRSFLSGPADPDPRSGRLALMLIGATALVRLLGRLLAINVLGALALVFDVAALGLALGLGRRRWPVHPAALAFLFAFSLPIEQILQRLAGFPLRLLSAIAAHGVLFPFTTGLERQGTLLVQDGLTLAVDLPCSGAQGLMMLGVLAAVVACRRRMGPGRLAAAAGAVLAGALLSNLLRILGLYLGLQTGLQVMAEPWHSGIGLLALAIGCLPLLALAKRWPVRHPVPTSSPVQTRVRLRLGWGQALGLATAFSLAGMAIAAAPAHPVDVSRLGSPMELPRQLGTWLGTGVALSDQERTYFQRYGGQADKRTYEDPEGDAHTAVLVRTTAPLRHLHGPDRCLIGAGHRVERLGVLPGPIPAVVWRSIGPDGRAWRVKASFVSERGQTASSISEVVWRWLTNPGTAWTLLERVSPWRVCHTLPTRCEEFDAALFAALDFPVSPVPKPNQEVFP